jgi:hypothetical protein
MVLSKGGRDLYQHLLLYILPPFQDTSVVGMEHMPGMKLVEGILLLDNEVLGMEGIHHNPCDKHYYQ